MIEAPKRTSIPISVAGMLALALAGCTSAVVIESDFPTPLIEPLPVTVGLFYEPKLRNFIHAEALPRSSTWTIDLGDANLNMLDQQYQKMFIGTRELVDLPPSPADAAAIDAVLTSQLEQFQFDVPRASRDEFVEVWLQYRLQLLVDGDLIVEWLVNGYGKSEIDGSREEAVERAAIVAMREAGARISTQFSQQPSIKNWLEAKQNAI